jgi:hypothetical protein
MIIIKNNNQKINLDPYYTRTNNKMRYTVSIYDNKIYSISDNKMVLYLHEDRLLDIPFVISEPTKQYKLDFYEYTFNDNTIAYISDTVNFKNSDYNFVIFTDTDGYPYVYNYIITKYQVIDNQFIKFDKKKFMKMIMKHGLL